MRGRYYIQTLGALNPAMRRNPSGLTPSPRLNPIKQDDLDYLMSPASEVSDPEAFEWHFGSVPVSHFTKADLWGVGYGVPRGKMTLKLWERWMNFEEAAGYDFSGLRFPITTPVIVTYDGGNHMHLWDGWHRAALAVVNSALQSEVPALIGVLRPGEDAEALLIRRTSKRTSR